MSRMKLIPLLFIVLCTTTAHAQRLNHVPTDTSTVKWRLLTSFNPILAGSGFQATGQDPVLIGLQVGGELRMGMDLWEDRYRVGASGKLFWTTGNGYAQSGWYHLVGLYNQYDFFHKQRNRLFVELGGYYSNLCFCERGQYTSEPINRPGTWYLSIGGGMDFYLHPRWDLKLGYQHHILLNGPAVQNFWGQFMTVGFNYYWYKRQKPGWGWKKRYREAQKTKAIPESL